MENMIRSRQASGECEFHFLDRRDFQYMYLTLQQAHR